MPIRRIALTAALLFTGCDESTDGDLGALEFSLAYDCQSFFGRTCAPKRSLDHALLVNSAAQLLVTGEGTSVRGRVTVDSADPGVATCQLVEVDGADWDWQGHCSGHAVGSTKLSVRADGGALIDTVSLRVGAAASLEADYQRTRVGASDAREGSVDWGAPLRMDVGESLDVGFWPFDADGEGLVTSEQPVRCESTGATVAISPADCFVGERRTFSVEGKAPGEVEVVFTLGEVSRSLTLSVR